MEKPESYILIDFFNSIPTNYGETYEELRKLNLSSNSLYEENQELLFELKSRENSLKTLGELLKSFIEITEKETDNLKEIIIILKNKLEKTIIKLNTYKIEQGDLIKQNKALFEKIDKLNELLDNEEKKNQGIEEFVRNYEENLEVFERRDNLTKILNPEKSLLEFIKENIEEIKINFPKLFCKCLGNYEQLKLKYESSIKENGELKENLENVSLKHIELSETNSFLKTNNELLKKEIVVLKEKGSNIMLSLLLSKEEDYQDSPENQRSQSMHFISQNPIMAKHQKKSSFSKKPSKYQEITCNENFKKENSIEEGMNNISLRTEIENTIEFNLENKDILNNYDKKKILDTFEKMEIDSPINLKKPDKTNTFQTNVIKLQQWGEENEVINKTLEKEKEEEPKAEIIKIENKINKKLKREQANKFSIIILTIMFNIMILLKVTRFTSRIISSFRFS